MASIAENHTWEVIPFQGQKLVGSRWVFTRKPDLSYKARIVAQGFTQKYGFDYTETFAPVAKMETLRLLLALTAILDWELQSMDVITAFLNGDLQELIYMEMPEGYRKPGHVCKLLRSLYGLKQSPRQWYQRLDAFLIGLRFKRSISDETLYFKKDIWVLVYVDDLFLTGMPTEIKELKQQLKNEFRMKDLGSMRSFLGMEILRNRPQKLLFLNQTQYLKKVLATFKMESCNGASNPFPTGAQLIALPQDTETGHFHGIVNQEEYRTLVGSLLYASTHSRPDLAYSVGALARHVQAPGQEHWLCAKHLLRYLKSTIEYGILFNGNILEPAFIHSDSDYGGDRDTRKSTTGMVSILAGAAITWSSKLQRTVALSTMESEYMALSISVKEALWFSKLFRELCGIQGQRLPSFPQIITVSTDNTAALILSKNPEQHAKAKHIDIQYHFIRDEYENRRILLTQIPTKENRADIFTKPLPRILHQAAIEKLGLSKF